MISAGKVSDVDYYVGSVGAGRESYYLDAVAVGEPPGRWSGALAESVGLTGEVAPEDMHTLFDKFVAPDGTQLGARPAQRKSVEDRLEEWKADHPGALREEVREVRDRLEATQRKTVLGWDLTFSVPKSVTVLHTAWRRAQLEAARSGDQETAEAYRGLADGIEEAVRTAGGIAQEHVASKALAQVSAGGKGRAPKVIRAPELAWASFLQHTSRAIDPQLHMHMVAFNKARCADGAFRALDGDSLLDDRGEYSAVADRALAEILGRMGIRMELRPDGVTREVVGVSEAHRDLFSSRRSVITGELAKAVEKAEAAYGRELTGREVWHLAQQVTLTSRAPKSHDGDRTEDEQYERWQREASIEVGEGLGPLAVTFREIVERGAPVEAETFSESDVVSRAVAACAEKRSAWRSSDLVREIEARLPNLGGVDPQDSRRLLVRLTERALSSEHVVQVSGRVDLPVPVELSAEDGQSYDRPSSRRFAAAKTVMAEEALRRNAVARGYHHLDTRQVRAWLGEHGRGLGVDQSEAVHGLATSDAGIVQMVGPAGAGKSLTVGAFADLWEDLSGGGRVHGLAVGTKATEVLADDGLRVTANVEKWLTIQARLSGQRPVRGDSRFMLSARDVVMVDEASMVSTKDLTRVRQVVEAAGARLMLTGDPRQLASVEAGGVMGLLDAHAETFSLSDVRRFDAAWEPEASLALRDGDPESLRAYDRHGRIVETATMDEALRAAARAAVADIVDGKESLVVAGSNEDASRVAALVREQLVDLGMVEPDGVTLADGGMAGRHDMVMARKNDRRSSLVNRGLYRVQEVRSDGGLTVVDKHGQLLEVRADYAAELLSSAYGTTVHAAQGVTVDRCHLVTDGSVDAAALYVALTRGRERNTAYVSTGRKPAEDETNPQAVEHLGATSEDGTTRAKVVEASNDGSRASARVVLADALRKDGEQRAAVVERERDDARQSSMDYLLGRREDAVLRLCRMRLDDQLDRLVESGALSEDSRAQLGADQGTDHVAKLLRGAEQAGHDPAEVLRSAVGTRDFAGSRSVAQVLSKRISSQVTETDPTGHAPVPAGLTPGATAFLQGLEDRMRDRELVLGAETAQEAPEWATRALGAVPADEAARADWEQRAGKVAGAREGTGWEHPVRPLDDAPGISRPERRALHWSAWEALGRPEADRAEAAMTTGQLRLRVEAWDRQKQWAPAYADDAMKLAELEAEKARQESLLAEGDAEAAQWMETYEERAAVARVMGVTATARDAWVDETAAQRATAERATFELTTVRQEPVQGEEEDRCTAEEWLAEDAARVAAEDPHRVVTEVDVHVPERDADLAAGVDQRSDGVAVAELPQPRRVEGAEDREAPTHPDLAVMEAMVRDAGVVMAHVEDRRSLEASAPAEDDSHLVEEYDVAGGHYQRVPVQTSRDELVSE